MTQPIDPDADTDKLMMGVQPLEAGRIREILTLVSRAQTYGKPVELPANDVLAMVAEVRLHRRYAQRSKNK